MTRTKQTARRSSKKGSKKGGKATSTKTAKKVKGKTNTKGKSTKTTKQDSKAFVVPKWANDHAKEIENISHFVTTTLEERESHLMPQALLFDEIKDEFGAKFLRKMMGIESRGKFNDKVVSELFGIMQSQQRVSITNDQIGFYVEEKKKEAPLADWCGDHTEDIQKIGEFVKTILKAEGSKQMSRDDVSEEVRDEFGKKYLRKMMKVEEKKIAKEKWSELFEALKRGKYLVIIPGKDEGEEVFKLGGEEKAKETKKEKKETMKENPKKRVAMDDDEGDMDDMKVPEPPTKKRKLDTEKEKKQLKTKIVERKLEKAVKRFNVGKLKESEMVSAIKEVLSRAKEPLDIHFHFEIPSQKKDIDVDSVDSSDSSDSIPIM